MGNNRNQNKNQSTKTTMNKQSTISIIVILALATSALTGGARMLTTTCPSGQKWDGAFNKCVCENPAMYLDTATNTCMVYQYYPPTPHCPSEMTYTTLGTCVCNDPSMYMGPTTNTCISYPTVKTCKANQTMDNTSICRCNNTN